MQCTLISISMMNDNQLDLLYDHLRTSTEQLSILVDGLVTANATLRTDLSTLAELNAGSPELQTNLAPVTQPRPLRNLLGLLKLHK